MHWDDGQKYEGFYKNDKRHGNQGVLTTNSHYSGGDRLMVEYKDGNLHRSKKMKPDYEIDLLSLSGLPYRTHTFLV